MFDKHPTASFKRKHYCKECGVGVNAKRHAMLRERLGKQPRVLTGITTTFSVHKRGDKREDGMVFWSKRKTANGFREWWMTQEQFDACIKKQKDRINWRYHNDHKFREKSRLRNSSEESKMRKRCWNKKNRPYLDSWQSERRAKIRGNVCQLTEDEKKRIRNWYQFRDALNRVHGKAMFHVDHKQAISRGGLHHPDNMQVTTAKYNVKKFVNPKPV